jgi:shikimate kinase
MNLVLIGFMACGKSLQGKLCAHRLKMPLRDIDAVIERSSGCSISEIFGRFGEEEFRQRERQAIERAASGRRCVIATGGGAVLDPRNVEALRRRGKLVLLTASVDVILERISRKTTRPLLASAADPRARIEAMLEERDPCYRGAADWTVDTSNRTAEDVNEEIVAWFRSEVRGY